MFGKAAKKKQSALIVGETTEQTGADSTGGEKHFRAMLVGFAFLSLLAGGLILFGENIANQYSLRAGLAVAFLMGAAYSLYLVKKTVGPAGHLDGDLKPDADHNVSRAELFSGVIVGKGDDTFPFTDKLTGLGNRARFQEKFTNLAKSHDDAKSGGHPFAVGVVNLDGMKPINDLFGRNGGDELIKQCSQRLKTAVDGMGFVFRNSGDEFAFVFPQVSSKEEIRNIGTMLQEVLNAHFDIGGSSVRVSGSFGFGVFPEAGETFERVSANIETALYHSKQNGHSRITVYSNEIEDTVRENALLEQALRKAISDKAIYPHFQPIISLQSGKLLGFESLARWIDPELGFVSPARFIPLAEERGIIAPLTEVLLDRAARAAADWPEELFLSFNLSSVQLVDPDTAKKIIEIINRAGLPPQRLEIEVTETAIMTDPVTATYIIEELHNAGIRISMDDFGTGQSSLGRLRELKLDKVKIDRAFINAIGEDKPAEHIVRAILEMCEGLDLKVVAEGIEEVSQAESLKQFGCHAGQGYLFGKPQDATRTMGYIREFSRIAQSDREIKIA